MKITYDQQVDALYIRFKETTVTTQHLAEELRLTTTPKGVWLESKFSMQQSDWVTRPRLRE
jgi:hypothetical protein